MICFSRSRPPRAHIWQPYRNETQYVLTPTAHQRISTIAFHLAALVK
jgi:hypothetical protein